MFRLVTIYASLMMVLVILSSCATARHQKGEYAFIVNGKHPDKLPITAFIDESKSTKHFKVVNVQFKNESDEWVRVKTAKVIKLNDSNIMAVTEGQDLKDWRKSFYEFKTIEDHNEGVEFLGAIGIGLLVATAAVVGGNEGVANLSMAATQSAVAIKTIEETNESVEQNLENSKLQDENYLSKPFSLAPGMVMRKWVLLQIPKDKDLRKVDFEVEYERNDQAVAYKVDWESEDEQW